MFDKIGYDEINVSPYNEYDISVNPYNNGVQSYENQNETHFSSNNNPYENQLIKTLSLMEENKQNTSNFENIKYKDVSQSHIDHTNSQPSIIEYQHSPKCFCSTCLKQKQKNAIEEQKYIKSLLKDIKQKNDLLTLFMIFIVVFVVIQCLSSKFDKTRHNIQNDKSISSSQSSNLTT